MTAGGETSGYLRRVYDLPAELEDRLSAALWRHGALGCEVKPGRDPGRLRVEAWFSAGAPRSSSAPLDLSAWSGVDEIAEEEVADQDWLAPYRATSQPFDIGRRFRLDPRDDPAETTGARPERAASDGAREPEIDPGGRIVLRVPAENAFGTGSHESTKLMLRWLEKLDLRGARVLDVGTGSGILAFAAAHLGATSILGFDLDAPSVITARRNRRRNLAATAGADLRWLAGRAASLAPRPAFDLLLVNVLPERIEADLPRLVSCLKPGGQLLSSGNLVSKRLELLPRFTRLGLASEGELEEGEWLSFLFRRPSQVDPALG